MKILNIDRVAPPARTLVMFGKTYEFKGMSVGNFIQSTLDAERLKDETSLAKQIEATIEMVMRAVPGIPKDDLQQLSLEQLQTVVAYVRGDEVEAAEESPADGEGGEKK